MTMPFDLIEAARAVVSINSSPGQGTSKLVDYIHPMMLKCGFNKITTQDLNPTVPMNSKSSFQERSPRANLNLIGIMGDELVDSKIKKGVLLQGHLDTPDSGDLRTWTETAGDPFNATIKDGKLYGLGAASPKVDFLCKMLACKRFDGKRLKRPIYLAGTSTGNDLSRGLRFVLDSGHLNPEFALVGAATDLSMIGRAKGHLTGRINFNFILPEKDPGAFNARLTLLIRGKSDLAAHHTEHEGNALLELFELLDKLQTAGFPFALLSIHGGTIREKTPEFAQAVIHLPENLVPEVKTMLARVPPTKLAFESRVLRHTGVKLFPPSYLRFLLELKNLVAQLKSEFEQEESAKFYPEISTMNIGYIKEDGHSSEVCFSFRLLPERNVQEFREEFEKRISSLVFPGSEGGGFEIDIQLRMDLMLNSFEQNPIEEIDEVVKNLDLKQVRKSPVICDELNLLGEYGTNSYAFGAGSTKSNIFCPNEFVELSKLEKSVEVYTKILEKLVL